MRRNPLGCYLLSFHISSRSNGCYRSKEADINVVFAINILFEPKQARIIQKASGFYVSVSFQSTELVSPPVLMAVRLRELAAVLICFSPITKRIAALRSSLKI